MDHSKCPQCGASFPFRSNKRFCSATCRKLSSQKVAREKEKANALNSKAIRRDQAELFDLAMRMSERLYSMPPFERLGYLQGIIELARSGECRALRKILTMPTLLRPDPSKKYLFWRRSREYPTIAQAADRYCRHFWNASVIDVVQSIAPEPPTGEVLDEHQLAA